jgi:hypothetical protein
VSWQIGYDRRWKRDIGYGVPCVCDHFGLNNRMVVVLAREPEPTKTKGKEV